MAETNVLRRYLDAGMAFTQLTQSRAESIVRDLVQAGEVQTGQAQATVADLLERSRKNTERLIEQVRRDVRDQVANLGLATKADIARLERQISAATASTASTSAARKTSTKRAPTKRTSAKKTTAKKTTARRSSAKKATRATKASR